MTGLIAFEDHAAIVLAEAELLVWLAAEPIKICGTAEDYAAYLGIGSVDPWLFNCVIQGLRCDFIAAPQTVRVDDTESPDAYLLLALR